MENQHPPHVDVRKAAQSEQLLQGGDQLSNFQRLAEVFQGQAADTPLEWMARFDWRVHADGAHVAWLHLGVNTRAALVCQRCLGTVVVPIEVSRDFRFVASEAVAQEQDDQVEEDLLVVSRAFDLAELVEDEVLLALPLVPRHDVCPRPVTMTASDADFDSAEKKPHPFAVLAKIKGSS